MTFGRANANSAISPHQPIAGDSGITYTTTGTTYTAIVPPWAQSLLLQVVGGAGNPGIVTVTWTDYALAAGGVRTQVFTFTSTQQIRCQIPVLGTNVQITIQGRVASATGVTWNLMALASPARQSPAVGLYQFSGVLVLPASGNVIWSPTTYSCGGLWYLSMFNGAGTNLSVNIQAAAPTGDQDVTWDLPAATNRAPFPIVLPSYAINVKFTNLTAVAGSVAASLFKAD